MANTSLSELCFMYTMKCLSPSPVCPQLVKIFIFEIVAVFFLLIFVFMYQPIYGFTSNDPPRFKRAAGHKDLFYIDDKDVDIKDVRFLGTSRLLFY